MRRNKLLNTYLLISVILICGFLLTIIFSYRANYTRSQTNIEQIGSLTMEGVYSQLTSLLIRPVSIVMTMANDRLLISELERERDNLDNPGYIRIIQNYLAAYHEKYGFDSLFLVSRDSGRYYSAEGIDRIMDQGDQEEKWYYDFLKSENEYELNVDADKGQGANREITVFINCKIITESGKLIGVIGVGIRLRHFKRLLENYENQYGVEIYFLDATGKIEISTTHAGYEDNNWFELYGMGNIEKKLLGWKDGKSNLSEWVKPQDSGYESVYLVCKYIPELAWYLLVERNATDALREMRSQLYRSCAILAALIACVLLVISMLVRNFRRQVTELVMERQAIFRKATAKLYENIHEFNISRNTLVDEATRKYFESLGARNNSYDQALRLIAEKQVDDEFRGGYLALFGRKNVLEEFKKGNTLLNYDVPISFDGQTCHWMRIDAHIFKSPEDGSIHMFTYRRNIDDLKRKELQADMDAMTHCYNKMATERIIDMALAKNPGQSFAFFIFDIDNFKQANDGFGHAFGDMCIKRFASILKQHFRRGDIVGRIGGDEFVALILVGESGWVERKAEELSRELHTVCRDREASWQMSASIGIALSPEDGTDFASLYRSADKALYQTKKNGKNSFSIYNGKKGESI